MLSAVTALVLSCLVTTLVTPPVRAWAIARGVVDEPGGRRVHKEITPRLGGVALFVGFFAPLAAFAIVGTSAMGRFLDQTSLTVGLVLGSTVVVLVGALDDMKGLGAWPKLLAQAAAATIAYFAGFEIQAVGIPGIGVVSMGPLAYLVTLFWFLGVINALNLIDGLDGLAAGIALFASLANFVISYFNDAAVGAMLSASLAGALLGFLRYNFNPARIFMGDSGSMFLGFVLAATSIRGATTKSSTAVAILAPMVALGVPIFDTMLAMIRRTLARQPIFSADRGHIHHRLLDLGLTHRRVVLVLYGSSVALAAAAVGIAFGRSWHLGGALLLAGASIIWLVRRAGLMSPPATQQARVVQQRVREVLAALSEAGGEADVRASFASLADDLRLIAVASRRAYETEQPSDAEWVIRLFELEGRSYRLEYRRSTFERLRADRDLVIERLRDACRQALERGVVPGVRSTTMPVVGARATAAQD